MNIEQIHSISIRRSVMGRKGALLASVCLAPLMAAAMSATAHAGEWKVIPSISFAETYTDNVQLSSSGSTYDWVQTLSPRLNITATGRRVNANITGGVDYLYFDRLNKDNLRPNVQGTATVEAVPDLLKIDARASVSERLLNPAGAYSISPYNDTPNRQTLQTYSAGPTLFHHFGSFTDVQLSYLFTFGKINRSVAIPAILRPGLTDTYLHQVNFQATSGERFTTFTWNLAARYSTSTNSSPQSALTTSRDWASVQATGNYVISPRIALIAIGGYDHTNGTGVTSSGAAFGSGPIAMGGFEFHGPRTTLRATAGRRFNGLAFDGNLSYAFSSRTTLTASYTQEITTSVRRLAALLGITAANNFADTFNLDPKFTLSDEVFYSRRAGITLAGSRHKNRFSITGFADRRSYRLAPRSDWVYGGRATFNRQLNRKWTFDVLGLYTYQDFNNTFLRRDNIYAAQVGLTDQFARSFRASLTYRFSYRNSSNQLFDMKENSITLLLTTVF